MKMNTIVIDLSSETYRRLQERVRQVGKDPTALIQEFIEHDLKDEVPDEADAVPLLGRLQERTRRLEAEIVALRADLDQVTTALARPAVAVYEVDGEQIVVTEADVEVVRTQLVRPHAEEAIRELALVNKLAEREKDLPEEERERRFWEIVEAIRTEAIAKGVAIDDPMEAVVDD